MTYSERNHVRVSELSFVVLLAAVLAGTAGCKSRPRAPALEDGTVYQNDGEGFRFLVPEGWAQQTRSGVPPGRLDRDLVLVQYRRFATKPPAALAVSARDLPPDTDLGRLLAGMKTENTDWALVGSPKQVKVGNRPGQFFVLNGKAPTGALTREVIAVRRDERVYFFSGTYTPSDHTSRDLIRQTFANVVWK
jgi:hypothetical protein